MDNLKTIVALQLEQWNLKMEQMRPDMKFYTLFSLEVFVCHKNTMVINERHENTYNDRHIQLSNSLKNCFKLRFQCNFAWHCVEHMALLDSPGNWHWMKLCRNASLFYKVSNCLYVCGWLILPPFQMNRLTNSIRVIHTFCVDFLSNETSPSMLCYMCLSVCLPNLQW